MTAPLYREGWVVNAERAARISRREGLKVPQIRPKNESALVQFWFVQPPVASLQEPLLVP